jgi:hypothetical protein
MDVYTKNGNIIRHFPKEDGTTEVQLQFLFDNGSWSRLFALTIFYVAFHRQLGIPYVASSATQTKVVVRQEDFGKDAQQKLIDVMLEVRDNANLLNGMADRHLYGKPLEAVDTNSLELLEPYKAADVQGKVFLEHFAEALAGESK